LRSRGLILIRSPSISECCGVLYEIEGQKIRIHSKRRLPPQSTESGGWGPRLRFRSTGDGGDQEDTVAFLEGAGFAAQEADVLFVEIHVEELADLALLVAGVPPESGRARGKLGERVGDGGRATVYFRRAVREAAESRWNFDRHWPL